MVRDFNRSQGNKLSEGEKAHQGKDNQKDVLTGPERQSENDNKPPTHFDSGVDDTDPFDLFRSDGFANSPLTIARPDNGQEHQNNQNQRIGFL